MPIDNLIVHDYSCNLDVVICDTVALTEAFSLRSTITAFQLCGSFDCLWARRRQVRGLGTHCIVVPSLTPSDTLPHDN